MTNLAESPAKLRGQFTQEKQQEPKRNKTQKLNSTYGDTVAGFGFTDYGIRCNGLCSKRSGCI